jgi:hypothetical protein
VAPFEPKSLAWLDRNSQQEKKVTVYLFDLHKVDMAWQKDLAVYKNKLQSLKRHLIDRSNQNTYISKLNNSE